MSDFLASWIQLLTVELLLLVALLAFLESLIVVGLFVSGFFLLTTCSVVYAQGNTSLMVIVVVACAGRFLPAIRSVSPALAGITGIRPVNFSFTICLPAASGQRAYRCW
jgi:membrane protein DedA with SNARE-associated domain